MVKTPDGEGPRRERLRARTLEEIKECGFALVDDGGVSAVTIAALGKAMGMTPPSLYRYHASRDAVVDALVAAAYTDLGLVVEKATVGGSPEKRLDRLVREYRRWALEHPRRYAMLFGDRAPGTPDPADGVVAFNRGMQALLAVLSEMTDSVGGNDPLDSELQRWSEAIDVPAGVTPRALRLGVQLWYRMHGLVSLEIAGAFANMGLDAEHLLTSEIRETVAAADAD
ncbi:TetR-like C-terminal domain-containing protein [Actinoplanes sp. NBRC 101535]|uniref:TetR/AcrR family transcriptional regulator n=1 Tax=Actinoplanes sp. NBRC 101535 TaxID=3032196 RepID=UPI00255411B4|nr:TetR-like C-terminal domain-containing protein [Actinoplanes sp. NBRC 101535]